MSSTTAPQTQESIDNLLTELLTEYQQDPLLAFEDGVTCAYDTWQTLQIAVDNQLAGIHTTELIDEFIQSTVDMFTENSTVYSDEVSDWLYNTLSETFNITADDGSCEHMARLLCTMYTDCSVKHDYTGICTLLKRSDTVMKQLIEQRQVVESDSSTDGSDSDTDVVQSTKGLSMAEYSAQQIAGGNTAAADEDGWTTVSKGKK